MEVKLASGKVPDPAFASDYTLENGEYKFSSERAAAVGNIYMELASTDDFVEYDGKYYAALSETTGSEVDLGDVILKSVAN